MIPAADLKTRRIIQRAVRQGRLSAYEALDLAVTARLRGAEIPALEEWASDRIKRLRSSGKNPLLRRP